MSKRNAIAAYGIALLMLGCDDGGGPTSPTDKARGEAVTDPAEEEADAKEAEEDPPEEPDEIGLSCEVKQLLVAHCQACHAPDAKNGTPLMKRDDLLAMSKKDPNATVIQRALLRVAASEKPMPPVAKNDPLSAEEQALLRRWVEDGTPAGRCDAL